MERQTLNSTFNPIFFSMGLLVMIDLLYLGHKEHLNNGMPLFSVYLMNY
jgi:hypothetical protein